MSNMSNQKVELYGTPEHVQEVLEHIKKEGFGITFPRCSEASIEGTTIHITTSYAPSDLEELSKKFPKVGFVSNSIVDGQGSLWIGYYLGGFEIYYVYLDLEAPKFWREITGNQMKIMYDLDEHEGTVYEFKDDVEDKP